MEMPVLDDAPKLPDTASPPTELSSKVQGLLKADAVLPSPKPEDQQGMIEWMVDKASDIAILTFALVNLALVFFDYTYVDFRPFYQAHQIVVDYGETRYRWDLVKIYDPIKGIDPHRSTTAYLTAARDALAKAKAAPDDPATLKALAEMRENSTKLIKDEDVFNITNQRGVLERIKHTISKHMMARAVRPEIMTLSGEADVPAARKAFYEHSTLSLKTYWTPENLAPAGFEQEEQWFEGVFAPLVDRAYYRHYGENGKPQDDFKRIDLAFAVIFLIELLARMVWMLGVKRDRTKSFKQSFNEFSAVRWVDYVYFLPLALYWLPPSLQGPLQLIRMFSVGFRMQKLGLINPVAVAQKKAEDVTNVIADIVNVKLLTNYQQGVREWSLEESMRALTPQQRKQLTIMIQRNLTMVLRDVLPEIAPQIEKLALRAATQAMEQAPAYQQLKRFPLFGALPERMLPNLVGEVLAGTQVTMLKAINDAENVKLTNEMIDAVTESLLKHMTAIGTEAEIKTMLIDLLEEQKRKVLAD
ncbi:MAG: hypothetical protein JWM80_3063 [Cyanobacteria bacterium RYN_339]|nr:hypothetical protein [Cyanobacteria bacterium RYN_339]